MPKTPTPPATIRPAMLRIAEPLDLEGFELVAEADCVAAYWHPEFDALRVVDSDEGLPIDGGRVIRNLGSKERAAAKAAELLGLNR